MLDTQRDTQTLQPECSLLADKVEGNLKNFKVYGYLDIDALVVKGTWYIEGWISSFLVVTLPLHDKLVLIPVG